MGARSPKGSFALVQALSAGGVLATQIPDITEIPAVAIMREVANNGPWVDNPGVSRAVRGEVPRPESYYDLLKPLCAQLDIWRTTYSHVLPGPEAGGSKDPHCSPCFQRSMARAPALSSGPTPPRLSEITAGGSMAASCWSYLAYSSSQRDELRH